MARLEDLRQLREDTLGRLGECSSDQNFAILGRLLVDVIKQIDELGGVEGERPRTGLSEFEEKMRERQSGSSGSRRSS